MYWNYLIIALRNQLKHPGFSALSIFGLMLGLSVTTLVFLYVWQETHYDRHLPEAEKLYVVEANLSFPGRAPQLVLAAPGPLAAAAENLAGVEETSRLWLAWHTLSIGDRLQFNSQMGAADPNLPALLGLSMLAGDARALQRPTSVLISESMAERLFGSDAALARTITLNGDRDLVVGGVYRDMPEASHLALDILLPLNSAPVTDRVNTFDTNWGTFSQLTYLRINDAAQVESIEQSLEQMIHANAAAPEGMRIEDLISVGLEPLVDLHLNGKDYSSRPKGEAGNATQLWIAATIALLIMLVACINTVNMATARSSDRAREVAMRKVVGASRAQLITQFIGESALLVLAAALGALVIVEIAAGPVGDFVGRDLSLGLMLQPAALIAFALVLILVILMSGLYPAFVLARHRPHAIFQPASSGKAQGFWSLRTVLVVFQFCASITLIILAAAVWSQVRFLQSADLGFEASEVVQVHGIGRGPAATIELSRRLDQALEGRPGILLAAAAESSPSWDYAEQARVRLVESTEAEAMALDKLAVDLDFFELLGVEAIDGRLFSEQYGSDLVQWDLEQRRQQELPVVLNMTAVASLGLGVPSEALGRALDFEVNPGTNLDARIVGVVPDFHFKSLKTTIAPMLFYPDPGQFSLAMVRFEPGRRSEGMASLEAGWNTVFSGQALSWSSLDVDLVNQYAGERRQFTVLAVLAGIAVLIALLGLFGLLAHVIAGRRKEISLRKVLGAEKRDVLQLFLWQFSRPVLIAVLVSWPLAWLLASRWLDGFAYRIDLSPMLFIAAALIALLFTWVLTAMQVVRVSRTRPALVLRAQ